MGFKKRPVIDGKIWTLHTDFYRGIQASESAVPRIRKAQALKERLKKEGWLVRIKHGAVVYVRRPDQKTQAKRSNTRSHAKVDQGGIRKIAYNEIKPPLDPVNWTLEGTFKFERSGGMWYSNAPKGHWMRDIPLQEGIFVNTAHPGEIVRISGSYSEFAVYRFRRK